MDELEARLASSMCNPLLVRCRDTNTTALPDDVDYEELGCRVRLMSIVLSNLPLQLCDYVVGGAMEEAHSNSIPSTLPSSSSSAYTVARSAESGTSSQRSVEGLLGSAPVPAIFGAAKKGERRVWSAAMDEAVALANDEIRLIACERESRRAAWTHSVGSSSYATASNCASSSTTSRATLRFEPSTQRLELLSKIADHIRSAGGAISDGRGGHLARSRVKDDLQRLQLSLKYRLTALAPTALQRLAQQLS